MEKRKVAPINSEQKFILIEYVKKYPDLAKQKFTAEFTFKKAQKHWEEVTAMLNSIPGGSKKTWIQWRKTWSDLKKHAKNKASVVKKHNQGTGGGPAIPKDMTDTEKGILEIIGPVCQTGHEEITETTINFDFVLNEEPSVQLNTLQENSKQGFSFGEISNGQLTVEVNTPQESDEPDTSFGEIKEIPDHSYAKTSSTTKTKSVKRLSTSAKLHKSLQLQQNLLKIVEERKNNEQSFFEKKESYREEKLTYMRQAVQVLQEIKSIIEKQSVEYHLV